MQIYSRQGIGLTNAGGGSEPTVRTYAFSPPDGNTKSFRTGDAYYVEQNIILPKRTDGELIQLAGFSTLNEDNVFGNTNRFTDPDGTQDWVTYRQMLDHFTGYAWFLDAQSYGNWDASIDGVWNATLGGVSTWFLASPNQISTISQWGLDTLFLNWSPVLNFGRGSFDDFTSSVTTESSGTDVGMADVNNSRQIRNAISKAGSNYSIPCRVWV